MSKIESSQSGKVNAWNHWFLSEEKQLYFSLHNYEKVLANFNRLIRVRAWVKMQPETWKSDKVVYNIEYLLYSQLTILWLKRYPKMIDKFERLLICESDFSITRFHGKPSLCIRSLMHVQCICTCVLISKEEKVVNRLMSDKACQYLRRFYILNKIFVLMKVN